MMRVEVVVACCLLVGRASAFTFAPARALPTQACARHSRVAALEATSVDTVLVCGPRGGLCDAAAEAASRHSSVVREAQGVATVAVVCGDGGDAQEATGLAELVRAAVRCAPSRLVIVAPDVVSEASASAEGGGLGGVLKGLMAGPLDDADASASKLARSALAAGVRQVAVVRHGTLFGSDGAAAFADGLKKQPEFVDDFGKRGVRVVSTTGTRRAQREADAKLGEPLALSRRAAVGEAAAFTALSPQWTAEGQVLELSVRATQGLTGPETQEAWETVLGDALSTSSSDGNVLFRAELEDAARKLITADWLVEEWAPVALSTIDATLAVSGSRPVKAVLGSPTEPCAASLFWEDFDGQDVKRTGELLFDLTENQLLVRRKVPHTTTLDDDDELPGETDLLDNLADAIAGKQEALAAREAAKAPPKPPKPPVLEEAPEPRTLEPPAAQPETTDASSTTAPQRKPRRRASAVRSRAATTTQKKADEDNKDPD